MYVRATIPAAPCTVQCTHTHVILFEGSGNCFAITLRFTTHTNNMRVDESSRMMMTKIDSLRVRLFAHITVCKILCVSECLCMYVRVDCKCKCMCQPASTLYLRNIKAIIYVFIHNICFTAFLFFNRLNSLRNFIQKLCKHILTHAEVTMCNF